MPPLPLILGPLGGLIRTCPSLVRDMHDVGEALTMQRITIIGASFPLLIATALPTVIGFVFVSSCAPRRASSADLEGRLLPKMRPDRAANGPGKGSTEPVGEL